MSFFNDLWGGIKSVASPLMGIASQLAPMAGTMLGGAMGGPMGSQLGGMLGNMGGQLLGNLSGQHPQQQQQQPQPQQQQPQQMSPFSSGMNQMAQQGGQMANNAMNQYVPQQMQNMQMGQMGNQFGQMAGNMIDKYMPQQQGYGGPSLGQSLGGMLSHYGNQATQRYMPQSMQNERFGNLGGYGAGRMQEALDPYARGADQMYQQSMMHQHPQRGGYGGGYGDEEEGYGGGYGGHGGGYGGGYGGHRPQMQRPRRQMYDEDYAKGGMVEGGTPKLAQMLAANMGR